MEPSELRRFIAHTETRVSPKTVGGLYGRAEMLARMPIALQRWIVDHARGEEYMGFIVEPYCLFLAYEIRDEAAAQRMLPPGYRLVPTVMFSNEIVAAHEKCYRVPDDISIIGIDGHDLGELFGLTTIAQFRREQGELAASQILDAFTSPDVPVSPETSILPYVSVVRRSTRYLANTNPMSVSL